MGSREVRNMGILLLTVFMCMGDIGMAFTGGEPVGAASDEWHAKQAPLMTRWAAGVTPENVLAEYPRPQMVRDDWMNLNGLWQLADAAEGDAPPFGRDLGEQILAPFPVQSALSGVMRPADRVWYRRTFEVPDRWSGKRVLLHFDAVDWEATVYVNGKKLGEHRGGYDAFTFDITDALKPNGPQELVVGVFDPTDDGEQPYGKQTLRLGAITYTAVTGIWQTVWLEPVPKAYIENLRITPDVDAGCVRVQVNAGGVESLEARVSVLVDDRTVATAEGITGTEMSFSIPDRHLWTPDDPFLYDVHVEIVQDGKVVDHVSSYFGMRKVEIGKDEKGITRILLNGQFVFQNGLLDQGWWPDGLYTAPTEEALRYDIEFTKRLGFNLIRKHVKVEPQRWYYLCDKLGLLVWQDMPSGGNKTPESHKQFEIELKRMIDGLWNHPSIIMWVVFNEGWGQYDTERVTKWVKEMDPRRLANNASGWTDKGVGDVIDLHVYPGPACPDPEPTRAAVLGEFGGLGLAVDGHTWQKKAWGYQQLDDADALANRYEDLLEGVWAMKDAPGLSVCIYTQTTDVEMECNGLLTYDRAIIKMDSDCVVAANRGYIRPTINPAARIFIDSLDVTLVDPRGTGEIRYTDDGTDPTPTSLKYTGPIHITSPVTIKARTFWPGGMHSSVRTARFSQVQPRDPDNPVGAVPGLRYEYYESEWDAKLPDFEMLTPLASGTAGQFDLSLAKRELHFAFRFTGYVSVPRDGMYTFYTKSDDGAKLFIGKEEVVSNDGTHSVIEKAGYIALKSGLHSIMVTYFQGYDDKALEVSFEGPGLAKTPIPHAALFHDG